MFDRRQGGTIKTMLKGKQKLSQWNIALVTQTHRWCIYASLAVATTVVVWSSPGSLIFPINLNLTLG